MREESEDLCLAVKTTPDDRHGGFCKESRISYTREFLISLAELDACRELPRGFDDSILQELVDHSTTLSRPCHVSETGRFWGNPSPLLQNPEHGHLGSGTFPRISTCLNGTSFPILQGCGFHLLSRSTEPYRPPHLCKAKPSGRESNDKYNDETFGSSENLSQERVDEERRRRESFDLMRKVQERAIQEKKRIISGEHKESINPETTIFLEDAGGDERLTNKYCNLKEVELSFDPNSDMEGCNTTWITSSTQIPPGFTSKSPEYDLNSSYTSHPPIQQLELSDVKEDHAKNPMSLCCDLSHEEGVIIEESIPSVHNGRYSTKVHSPTDWNSCHRENSQSSSFKTHASCQCFLSFPQRRMGLSDVTGSLKLRNKSSDEFNVSETGNDSGHLNIVSKGHTRSFEKVPFSPTIGRMVLPKNSESSWIQSTESNRVTRNDVSEPFGSPLLAEDKYIALSRVNEPSVETNFEGIMPPGFIKQVELSKTEGGQSISDNKARQELDLWNGPASKHSPISGSAESDNICLPDEDSLIRVDDTVFPWETFRVAEDTSGSPVAIAEEQAVFGVTLSENRTQDLGSLNTSFQNFCIQQSYPQVCHPRLNPGNAYFHHFNSQQAQQNSKIRSPV